MNACSSYGPSFLRNTNLFEDKDGYKVLVKDNSEYNLTFEFYEELIRYINKGFQMNSRNPNATYKLYRY